MITDSKTDPGIYEIEIDLPQKIPLGYYEANMVLGVEQVPMPLTDVLACSNEFASERKVLGLAGSIYLRDRVRYTIGSDTKLVELTKIGSYCNYEPI